MRCLMRWFPALAIGAAFLGMPQDSSAALALRINGTVVTPTSVTPTSLFYTGMINDFTVTLTFGTNSPLAGSTVPRITSTEIGVRNLADGPRSITIEFTDTAFTYPGRPTDALVTNQIQGLTYLRDAAAPTTAAGTLSFRSAVDPNQTPFGMAAVTGAVGGVLLSTDPGFKAIPPTATTTAAFYNSNGYSLTSIANATLDAGVTFSMTGVTTVVATPEPGTIAMVLTGLPVAGLVYLRRRRVATSV